MDHKLAVRTAMFFYPSVILDFAFDRYLEEQPVLSFWPTLVKNLGSFRWSKEVDAAVKRSMVSLGLEGNKYVAVHLRRGVYSYTATFLCKANGISRRLFISL